MPDKQKAIPNDNPKIPPRNVQCCKHGPITEENLVAATFPTFTLNFNEFQRVHSMWLLEVRYTKFQL
jgi:hypothetical protein